MMTQAKTKPYRTTWHAASALTYAAVCYLMTTMIGRWTKNAEPVRSFSADMEAQGQVGRRHIGTVTVPVAQIVGSVGRARELRSDFLPLRKTWDTRTVARYRWAKKAMEAAAGSGLGQVNHIVGRCDSHGEYEARRETVLPPIELYKLGDRYYVLDGHHRVAAARSLGQLEMDAVVTEYMPARSRHVTEPAA